MRDLRMCFVGDSFVAGTGDPTGLGWTGRVAAETLQRGPEQGYQASVYHLGVRRETSLDIAARLVAETTARLDPAQDRRVVLSFGANDTTVQDGAIRVPQEQTLRAFGQMVAELHRRRTRVLLVGPPAAADDASCRRRDELSAALAREADALGITFLPTVGATTADPMWRQEILAGDGAHPGTEGYRRLADLVTGPILDWLAVAPDPV